MKIQTFLITFFLAIMAVPLLAYATDFNPLTATFEEYYQYYVATIVLVGGEIAKLLGLNKTAKLTKIMTIVGIGLAAVLWLSQNGTGSILEGIIGIAGALGAYDIIKAVGGKLPVKIQVTTKGDIAENDDSVSTT